MGSRPAPLPAWLGIVLAVGCGVRGAEEPAAPQPPRGPAWDLARALPRGADRCAVTRPGPVPQSLRELVRGLGRGGPLGWLPELPVVAHAWAERRTGDGRVAVGLLRFEAGQDPGALRSAVERALPLRVLWPGERCRERPCHAFRAAVADGRTVRVWTGEWPAAEGPGAEARCLRMARGRPDALEVSSLRGRVIVDSLAELVPQWIDTIVEPMDGGLQVVERRHMTSEVAAVRVRKLELAEGDAFAELLASGGSTVRRGRVLIRRHRFRYDDLALAAEDVRRLHDARRRSEPKIIPSRRVPMDERGVVAEQIALRRERLRQADPRARGGLVRDLHELLQRAARAHPRHAPFARHLFRLRIDPLGQPSKAREVAERMLRSGVGDRAYWERARREALALESAGSLERALVDDGVMSRREAGRAAPDLVVAATRGQYAAAERAYRIVRGMGETLADGRMGPVPSVAMPAGVVGAVARTLARLASDERTEVFFVLHGGALRWRSDPEACLPVHDAKGKRACFGRLGEGDAALAELVGPGAFDLGVAVVPVGDAGAVPVASMRWSGEVEADGVWRLRRASGGVSRAGWETIRRLVVEPLASFEPRLFPPPELELRLAEASRAQELVARARPDGMVRCEAEDGRVRCALEKGSEGAPIETLTDLVQPWAGPAAEKLFVRGASGEGG